MRSNWGHWGKTAAAITFFVSGLLFANQSYAAPDYQKLLASDGTSSNEFGRSVAISGDTAIIGTSYAEAAYIFARGNDGIWSEQAKLIATDSTSGDNFGWSVSISGDTALVGARSANIGSFNSAGSAYVFTKDSNGNWYQQAKLIASDINTNNYFGWSISVRGNTALIGAIGVNNPLSSSGIAYIFTRDVNGYWNQQARLSPSDGALGDQFGTSVSIGSDTALIGSVFADINGINNAGAAYVFTKDNEGNWYQQTKLTASDVGGSYSFGSSVAQNNNTAVVGAPGVVSSSSITGSAYIFIRDTSGNWSQQTKLTDSKGNHRTSFGHSVAISGNTTLVGAQNNFDGGTAAYIFNRDTNNNWNFHGKTTPEGTLYSDHFAKSVALDDNQLLIGAFRDDDLGDKSGSAYTFTLDSTDGDSDGIYDDFDNCPTISNNDQNNVDADNLGDVCDNDNDNDGVLDTNDAFPLNPLESLDTDNDGIGNNADHDDDGDSLPDYIEEEFGLNSLDVSDAQDDLDSDGHSNIEEIRAGTNLSDPAENPETVELIHFKLLADNKYPNIYGRSVAISGNTAIIGAPIIQNNFYLNGAAYIYTRNQDGKWSQQAKLTASPNRDSFFGGNVALNGNTALISSYDGFRNSFSVGSAYVFVRDNNGNWSQQALLRPGPESFDMQFGSSITLDGDTALISDSDDGWSDGYSRAGATYVFTRDTEGNWSQQAKLIADDRASGDNFGSSVALDSNLALIGAQSSDTNGLANTGAAYIFSRDVNGNWSQQTKLTASDSTIDDYFGSSVSLDSGTALIGATHVRNLNNVGAAYIFTLNTDSNWSQDAKLTASDGTNGDGFGNSVTLKNNTAVIGAGNSTISNYIKAGATYIYTRDPNGNWNYQIKVTANDVDNYNYFGSSVFFDGKHLLVGAMTDSAYIFDLDTDNDGVINIDDAFPIDATESLDTDSDGVGNNTDNDDDGDGLPDLVEISNNLNPLKANDATIDSDEDGYNNLEEYFTNTSLTDPNDTPLTPKQIKITPSDGKTWNWFGISNAIYNDTILVGAPFSDANGLSAGTVYRYEQNSDGSWSYLDNIIPDDISDFSEFGSDISISGNTALIGANGSGAAYAFVYNNGQWIQQAKLVSNDGDHFSFSLSLSGDTALIGALSADGITTETGAAYVFIRDTDGNWSQQAKLFASDGEFGDGFGGTVVISGDIALIDAIQDDDNGQDSGAVYVFERDIDGNWSQQTKLYPNDPAANTLFGHGIDFSGNTAFIGSLASGNAPSSGAVYVFDRGTDGSWAQQAKLFSSDGTNNEGFRSVSLSGNTAIIGASDKDIAGAAYIYTRDINNHWSLQSVLKPNYADHSGGFGSRISISKDKIVIGAPHDNYNGDSAGAIYVFDNNYDDSDLDFVFGSQDNCPVTPNTDQLNSDLDTLGNACDSDDDNDAVEDTLDLFPLDPIEWFDNDSDGIGDNTDTDDDNDGFSDVIELEFGTDPTSSNDSLDSIRPHKPFVLALGYAAPLDLESLDSSPFADTDIADGDFLSASEWQISSSEDFTENNMVLDRILDGAMNANDETATRQLPLSAALLTTNTSYWVKTRHRDRTGLWSAWSNAMTFSTVATDERDLDSNGVNDLHQVEGFVDTNQNNIDDIDESIKAIYDSKDGHTIGIKTSAGNLTQLATMSAENIPTDMMPANDFNYGLFSFRIDNLEINHTTPATIGLTFYFPEQLPADSKWYKYDVAKNKLIDLSQYIVISDNSIILTLTDGGPGDADGVVNGVIVDPSGVAINNSIVEELRQTGESGGGGGGALSLISLLSLLLPIFKYRGKKRPQFN